MTRRIRDIDVIRGFALFGVVWMNLHESTTWFVPQPRLEALASAPVDRIVDTLAAWLVLGKAQCLFGILFGSGFAIFTDRAMRRDPDARPNGSAGDLIGTIRSRRGAE